MLAIRLQRTGRKGHAQFRVVVQDARRTPTSGRYVYLLGNYDPHSKVMNIDKDKADYYLKNGARPSDRVARLLKAQGVKLPSWVQLEPKQTGKTRNPEKLRKNRPAEPEAPAEAATEAPAEAPAEASAEAEAPVEAPAEAPAEEAPAEEAPAKEETPADPEAAKTEAE